MTTEFKRGDRQQVQAFRKHQAGKDYFDAQCPRCGAWKALDKCGNTACACGQLLAYVEAQAPAPSAPQG